MVYHEKVLCILNVVGNKVAAYDRKVGFNTVEYKASFLYSDWLNFLWHGINHKGKYQIVPTVKLNRNIYTNVTYPVG